MQSIESLRHTIESAEELHSVVKTMKSLAAVNIRHYERAVAALAEYNRTVEMGLHIVLHALDEPIAIDKPGPDHHLGAVVFGTDQGLCGQYNEHVVTYAMDVLERVQADKARRSVIAVGARSAQLFEEAEQPVVAVLTVPVGIAGVTPLVQELLLRIEHWRMQQGVDQVILVHNKPLTGAAYQGQWVQLLPVDLEWLRSLQTRRWPSRVLPMFTMEWNRLFAALIRQYMFVVIYRACVESLAGENASRLAAMQNAEHNIQKRLQELYTRYHHERQDVITAELLDIVAGFEAVMGTR